MTARKKALSLLIALAPFAVAAQALKPAAGKDAAPHWADEPKRAETLERIKRQQEAKREEAAQKEAQKAAAQAARASQEQEAAARRAAEAEKAKEKQVQEARRLKEREARCVIKPVMTDADIEACRELTR